ncbi:hypothetical protein KXX69_009137 [Aspergillus fumigatus]|nr:hypothetical protein KXX69_009137 [Aspergillus fumigatus]
MGEISVTPAFVKELYHDLARKYHSHGTKIEQIWRSFDQNQREKAVKAGAAEGAILADPKDRTLGNMYKLIPEWNLQDLLQPESDYLLDHLKHRATNSLRDQYQSGVHGTAGDRVFVLENIDHLGRTRSTRGGFMLFINDAEYGESFVFEETPDRDRMMTELSAAINTGCCVSLLTGELILQRQSYLLLALNILIEDILEEGSSSREKALRFKKPEETAHTALSAMSTDAKPRKVSLQDVLALALDQKNNLEDYSSLCRTEPVFLAHAVNNWFFSQPGLVPDEKGRVMPLVTDKYISMSIFEVIHDSVIGAAIWDYVYRHLQVLSQKINDRHCRAIILQEMANICHFERCRVHKLFKRFVQMGSGSKYFKRVSGVYDDDCARALVVSSRSVEKYLRSVFNCTFGLAFMGTPHHGSDMAQWAETMRKFTSVFKQTNPELLRALERDSEVLARIQDEFHTLLRSRSKDSPLEIFCFYEEKPLTVVGTVVPMDSAILPGYLHASLPYDHRDMTKFASVDDPGFITVTNVLRRWAEVDRSEFVVPIGNANADIQASRFANSVIPKHDRALIVPTKVVAMDLSEEHTNGSNTKSLQKSPMDQCSTPLGRTDRSNPMMATVNACDSLSTPSRRHDKLNLKVLSGTSIANIITIPGTESITSTNERRYMPVLFHRLATAMNDQQNKRIIRWSEDGNTVVIVNEQVLTTKLLPAFNIPNYFSFTQQLEKLGFRWVEQGYEHPCFTRDIPEGQFHSIRGNDRTSLPSSSTDYQLIWPSNVANLRTPSSISVTETL